MGSESGTKSWRLEIGTTILGGLLAAIPFVYVEFIKQPPPPPPPPVVPLTVAGLVDLERPRGTAGPKVSLQLVPDQPDLPEGEHWAVAVTADRDGYVMILAEEHDVESRRQSVELLLPNFLVGRAAARVKAGETTYLPHSDPLAGAFALKVDNRMSRVTIRALFTTFPVTIPAGDAKALPGEDEVKVFFDFPEVRDIRLVDPTESGGKPFPSSPPFGEALRGDWAIATLEFTTNYFPASRAAAADEPVEVEREEPADNP